MNTGLVSVTFRRLAAEEIIRLSAECGLSGIEWGGDIHVPCGDLETARRVGEMTRAHGLKVICYGSYCRLTDGEPLDELVNTARALGAPLIRVWAGRLGSAASDETQRQEVIRNARKLSELADGLDITFEYHGNTLTDTAESARKLLEETDRANVGCLWQPPVGMSAEACAEGIRVIAPYIRNIHVFSWNGTERLPLEEGARKWKVCLEEINKLPGGRSLMLEFVRNDDPEQLRTDAACLKRWAEKEFAK